MSDRGYTLVAPPKPVIEAPSGGPASTAPPRVRSRCNVCGFDADRNGRAALVSVPCHVRAFKGERFHVWRCPDCRTIHCRDVVNLNHYYSAYPFSVQTRTWAVDHVYRNLASRVRRTGFRRRDTLLDYGCGRGWFVEYLRARGYHRCVGYDPYGPPDGVGSRAVLRQAPFDFIVLQDVFEHVESPDALLVELDGLLAPGGHVLVGTPNSNRIDLARVSDFLNELHVPYHLHVYTRIGVEAIGRRAGWTPVSYHDRPYHELPYLGLNTRAVKMYQRSCDGTLNSVLEPIRIGPVLASPRFHFLSWFGYWMSDRADMTVVFRKPGMS